MACPLGYVEAIEAIRAVVCTEGEHVAVAVVCTDTGGVQDPMYQLAVRMGCRQALLGLLSA